MRDSAYGAALFATYTNLKSYYVEECSSHFSYNKRMFRIAMVGAASGIAAWTICYPFDIVKSMI